jgi:amidase/aspartyl-tRNA(Asn)/glutamyl-tRNA(Gln) amidotransferase subunit A
MHEPGLDAVQLAQAIASGERSAREVLSASIDRVTTTDSRVNAFTDLTIDRALAKADTIDAQRARGEQLPALAGVPFAVKNLFDIAGLATRAGSKINRTRAPAQRDAFLVEQLETAGGVLLGALNMDEYAYGFTTENTHDGPCHNPHKLQHIAGGSSGGSAAAVAAGQVCLSLGSDTNGSIRVPASLCGVWGLKPTFGRLSRRGTFPFVNSLDHLGPFANTVAGLTFGYDALQGPDRLDGGCHAEAIELALPELTKGLDGLRIGVLGGYFNDHASPAALSAVKLAAQTLNARDEVIWPDAAIGRAAAFVITASEGGSLHLDQLRTRADDFEPLSVDRFIAGALQPVAWYLKAQRFRQLYRDRVNALFKDWDILLSAATPISAPVIGTEWIEINGQKHPSRPAMGLLTQPISFAGCPVVVAPMWPDGTEGMPIGVQLIAAPWREDLALRAASVLQQAGVASVRGVDL